MVKEKIKNNRKYFICGECGFVYEEKEWAEKCQNWCKKYSSCNIEIVKHAVRLK